MNVPRYLLVALATGCCQAAPRDSQLLAGRWELQPAVDPATPPVDDQWAAVDIAAWNYPGGNGAVVGGWNGFWFFRLPEDGPEWARNRNRPRSRGDIHRLWWRHVVTPPAAWQGQRVSLDLERIDGDAVVFWNGDRVAEVLQPDGRLDLTERVRLGEPNSLLIYLTRDYTGISRGFEQDVLRYTARGPAGRRAPMDQWPLGLTGQVRLLAEPFAAAVQDVFVQTSWRQQELAIEVEVDQAEVLPGLRLNATVRDADGQPVFTLTADLAAAAGRSLTRLTRPWPDPRVWELERPYLYDLTVSLSRGEEVVDQLAPIRFGFREVWTEGNQIIINGRPAPFRLGWTAGLTRQTLGLHRMVGLNVFEFQPNPTSWYDVWATGWPLIDPDRLAMLDEAGCGALVLAPTVTHFRHRLLDDPAVEAAHDDMLQRWLRRYRNHPSILAWLPSMNFVGNQRNIHADGMGQSRVVTGNTNEQVVLKSCEMIKAIDPTRLAFGHADGNIGDISSSNVYLNWVPLQEREEWPSEHAASGDLPYMAVEFGQPFTRNYWKEPDGPRFLLTEYLAMYFGEEAYLREGEGALREVVAVGLGAQRWQLKWSAIDISQWPLFWDLQELFIRQTDRAWRTAGVAGGWFYWDFDVGYGQPPEDAVWPSGPGDAVPDWVNPNFGIHAATMQPLLVYLGGAPQHTDKTHGFRAGETIQKQIVWIWDGPGERSLEARWELAPAAGGPPIDSGRVTRRLLAGAINMSEIACDAPAVTTRTELELRLTVLDGDETVATDRLAIQVFPATVEPLTMRSRVALFDPSRHTGEWLRRLGVEPRTWRPGESLEGVDLLVIGRAALAGQQALPYTAADVAGGLRVLLTEQLPETWEGLGLRSIETMPRYVYAAEAEHPVLTGLAPADLINWRGAPDLLPEKQRYRSHDFYHAPKWTNTHAVASTALELPETGGFRPVLACEFDLNYSPLLEWRCGRGQVVLSSLDLTDRVGVDPAATRLAANLLAWLDQPAPAQDQPVWRLGGEPTAQLLAELGFVAAPAGTPAGGVLVVGPGQYEPAMAAAWAAAGATVIVLPQPAATLTAAGFQVVEKTLFQTTVDDWLLLAGIGPRLLRWRDGLGAVVFAATGQPPGAEVTGSGLFCRQAVGPGQVLFIQADAASLAERYPADERRRKAVWPSVQRLRQLLARVMTNAGAEPGLPLAERFGALRAGASYETLATWQVCGPFRFPDLADHEVIGQVAAAEADAIAGNALPDLRYFLDGGAMLDWRSTVTAEADGFVNLGKALAADHHALAYVTRQVVSPTERTARLRLGVDFFLQAWLNGELVYDLSRGGGVAPRAGTHQVEVALREGVNQLTLKVAAGSKGFGFWADLSAPGFDFAADEGSGVAVDLYPVADHSWDPYHFHYY